MRLGRREERQLRPGQESAGYGRHAISDDCFGGLLYYRDNLIISTKVKVWFLIWNAIQRNTTISEYPDWQESVVRAPSRRNVRSYTIQTRMLNHQSVWFMPPCLYQESMQCLLQGDSPGVFNQVGSSSQAHASTLSL